MILLSLNVVAPLFIIMAVGYGARQIKLIDDTGVGTVNKLVFWIFLPALLFVSIYNTDFTEYFNLRVVVFAVVGTSVITALSFILVPVFEKKRERCGVIIQGIIRGNEVYFGFPIIASLIGEKYLGIAAIIVAFIVPLCNGISVVALETYKGEKTSRKALVINILKNPLIIVSAVAVIFVLLEVHVPEMIMSGLTSMSKVATPMALFLLGASFSFKSSGSYIKELVTVIALRLLILPGVVIGATMLLGFNDYETVVLFVNFGVPTAVTSYSMARQMGADSVLASQIVVYTSIFAIISVFAWTMVFQMSGII